MYILFCGANQKKVLQNEIKDIALEASNLSITFFFNYFLWWAKHDKGAEEVSKFVVCLQILLFLNNRSIDLLFIFVNERGWSGVKKFVISCRCHNCMITNIKKVMVLVMSLVPLLSETAILTSWYIYVQNEK